ncbi:MAG: hypothetical protein KDA27_28705, partial [Candidatus Eisenbacteria bacterium]|nr:hypothetical protein [Candidatus Eisenbacteria bacterium]
VVDDGRGSKPLDPAEVLRERREQEFAPESIGKLTRPVEIQVWERRVRTRFAFLADLDEAEQRWATCNARDRGEVQAACQAGGFG